MKKITFIGGGASSLISSIIIKQKNPLLDVFIIEKDKKLGKKLSMTGGGKCNIAPLKDDKYAYNIEAYDLIDELFKDISLKDYLSYLSEVGIETKTIKDYGYYPIHESAPQLVKNLLHRIKKLGINIINDEILSLDTISYNPSSFKLRVRNDEYLTDYAVFATGGLNKNIVHILDSVELYTDNYYQGLCPIRLKEDVSKLFGCRFECEAWLKYKDKKVKKYIGEIQFKKDALSGIPILNLSSDIVRRLTNDANMFPIIEKPLDEYLEDCSIEIGLNPETYFNDILNKGIDIQFKDFLMEYFKEEYVDYLLDDHLVKPTDVITNKDETLLKTMMFHQEYHIDSLYDFDSSQVTVGGIPLYNMTKDFEYRHINNLYCIGEMLNVDGYCGGYNLRFAITSGIKCALSILNKEK